MNMDTVERTEQPWRTANETVISAMEEFSVAEPKAVVIIFTDENGDVIIKGNTGKCLALGLIENAKHMILSGQA